MSHKIGNKNIERDSLRATIKALGDNPTFSMAVTGMTQQLKAKSRVIVSQCPLCKRIFHDGDALCGCRPAVTVSVRVPGKKRVKVECAPRVVGLENRHFIRSKMHKILRDEKAHRQALRILARQAAKPIRTGKFSELKDQAIFPAVEVIKTNV